jgi:hypothetical protein
VAQDLAAERRRARQHRQAAAGGEGRDAQDRIVPVVVGFAHLPEARPHREHCPGHSGRELERACEQGFATGRHDVGLDDACLRVGFHEGRQSDDGVAVHGAVGIEYDHVRVVRPARLDPFGDIAGLLADIGLAPAIEQAFRRLQALAQTGPGQRLLAGDLGILRVAQHEEVERIEPSGCLERAVICLEPGADVRRILIVDRYQDRRALSQRRHGAFGRPSTAQRHRMEAQHAEQESEEAAPERNRAPGKNHHEDCEERQLRDIDSVARQHLPHQEGAERRRRDDEGGQQHAPPAGVAGVRVEAP